MRTYRYGNDDNDDKEDVCIHIAYPFPQSSAMYCNLLQSFSNDDDVSGAGGEGGALRIISGHSSEL